jgi:hypothetical protein
MDSAISRQELRRSRGDSAERTGRNAGGPGWDSADRAARNAGGRARLSVAWRSPNPATAMNSEDAHGQQPGPSCPPPLPTSVVPDETGQSRGWFSRGYLPRFDHPVIIEMKPGHSLGGILHSWKSFSARQANKQLGRSGPFWHREYYDRFVRDAAHLGSAIRYVEFNPVNAGLCRSPEEWLFGSARWMAESLRADSAKPARMPAVPGDTSEECHLGAPASSTGSDEFDLASPGIQRTAAKDGGGPG